MDPGDDCATPRSAGRSVNSSSQRCGLMPSSPTGTQHMLQSNAAGDAGGSGSSSSPPSSGDLYLEALPTQNQLRRLRLVPTDNTIIMEGELLDDDHEAATPSGTRRSASLVDNSGLDTSASARRSASLVDNSGLDTSASARRSTSVSISDRELGLVSSGSQGSSGGGSGDRRSASNDQFPLWEEHRGMKAPSNSRHNEVGSSSRRPPPGSKPCSWEDILTDCLHDIMRRLPCAADRRSAHLACPEWLKAEKEAPELPPALPRLLLPAPDRESAGATRVVCLMCNNRVHRRCLHTPEARFFGSSDGGWIFMHQRDTDCYLMLKPDTGDCHGIPNEVVIAGNGRSYSYKARIHATALSSPPDDATCVAVSICTAGVAPHFRCVALWIKGWQHAMRHIRPPYIWISTLAEDVIYHDKSFYLLSDSDDLSICTTELLEGGSCREDWEIRRFRPGARIFDMFVRGRYLVSSRGGLLLVVRYHLNPDAPTSMFKVFQATERPEADAAADAADDGDPYPWAWMELDSLDGRILFVGHGYSKSYEMEDYKRFMLDDGIKLESSIYYIDDGDYLEPEMERKQYACIDNGKWSETHGVDKCFPPADASPCSPPAWLLR